MTSTINPSELPFLKHTTLPREILKWLQGLDLSYSVKDFRKDLKNGFLVAEIFSRYYPGKIQMHSFDNSHNSERKRNNWNLISLFLLKNQIAILPKQFDKIENGDSEQLYDFMCRIYTTLTQRKLSLQPLPQINTQSLKSENLTNSFLVKSNGLERLQGSVCNSLREDLQDDNSQRQVVNTQAKKPNLLKIPSKQITPTIQNNDSNVDMKSINIRQVNQNFNQDVIISQNPVSKLDNTKKQQIDDEQQQRSVMNYLNDLIQSNLQESQYRQDLIHFDSKYSFSNCFSRKINLINPQMVCLFFQQIISSKEGLISKIFKYEQQVWKFYIFLKSCMRQLESSHPAFSLLIDTFFQYLYESEQKYISYEFIKEYINPMLLKQIKFSTQVSKRIKIVKLLSRLTILEANRKALIMQFKQLVNNICLFMEFLSIFVQGQRFEQSGKLLIDTYVNYANLYLFSNAKNLRTYSLKIFTKIISENFVFGLKTFKPHYEQFSNMQDWQSMSYFIIILGILLSRITESKQYMNLIKQPIALSRTYNPDNEKMSHQMKEQIENISKTIYVCSQHNSNIIKKVAIDVVAPLLNVHPFLAKTFITVYLYLMKQENNIMTDSKDIQIVHDSKTHLELRNVGKQQISMFPIQILSSVCELFKQNATVSKNYDQHLNITILVQFCLNIIQRGEKMDLGTSQQNLETIFGDLLLMALYGTKNQQTQQKSFQLLQKLNYFYFTKNIKIKNYNDKIIQFISQNISNARCYKHFTYIFRSLGQQFSKTFNPVIKEFVDQFKVGIVNYQDSRLQQLLKQISVVNDKQS